MRYSYTPVTLKGTILGKKVYSVQAAKRAGYSLVYQWGSEKRMSRTINL